MVNKFVGAPGPLAVTFSTQQPSRLAEGHEPAAVPGWLHTILAGATAVCMLHVCWPAFSPGNIWKHDPLLPPLELVALLVTLTLVALLDAVGAPPLDEEGQPIESAARAARNASTSLFIGARRRFGPSRVKAGS